MWFPTSDSFASGDCAFRAAVSKAVGFHQLSLQGDETPALRAVRFGLCCISVIDSPAFKLEVGEGGRRTGGGELISVCVDRSAISTFETAHARFANVGPGLVIAAGDEEVVCKCEDVSRHVVFSLPRSILPIAARRAFTSALFVPVSEGGLPGIFHEVVLTAMSERERLSPLDRSRLQRMLVGMMADVLCTCTDERNERELGLATLRARAVELIQGQLPSLRGVEDLSDRLGCSTRHLYNAFKEHGMSPANYIWSLRLDRARAQIAEATPGVSMTNIAYSFGFQSYSHFSRAFKRQFGQTPQACSRKADQAHGSWRDVDESVSPLGGVS